MEKTDKLNLPYIMPQQAQKHVTHNEAIRALDAIIHLSVIDRFITNPPVNPAPGDQYIVANNGGGAWAGMSGKVAAWQDEGWYFYSPQPGWRVWITGESALLVWSGSEWLSPFASFPSIAINTGDDANNRLSAKLRSALFCHEDSGSGDVRVTINKATAGDTATLIFQTGFSGRAEFGLAGDDDWQVKVSPQGGDWYNALKVNCRNGHVTLGADLKVEGQVTVGGTTRVGQLSKSALPTAASAGAGALVWVSDAVGGASLACSDGGTWRTLSLGSAI